MRFRMWQQGEQEHFVHGRRERKGHLVAYFLWDVAHILFVAFGHNHFAEPGAICGQHLLLHTAHFQYAAAQGDFAREGEIATNRAA